MHFRRIVIATCKLYSEKTETTIEGLPGGLHIPLFPMKIYDCSLVPQKQIKEFPEIHFY